jgi:hypothetical protein
MEILMSRFDIRYLLILTLLLAGCGLPGDRQFGSVQASLPAGKALAGNPSTSLPATTVPEVTTPGRSDIAAAIPPQDCPLTQAPQTAFNPPPPYPPDAPSANEFWYGSNALWTAVPNSGVWSDLPLNSDGYTQKIFWWSEKFSIRDEPEPDLAVSGRRLDAQAAPLNVSRATNAFAGDIKTAMLVGVDFPTTGCWEITGVYKGAELSFVIWIAP